MNQEIVKFNIPAQIAQTFLRKKKSKHGHVLFLSNYYGVSKPDAKKIGRAIEEGLDAVDLIDPVRTQIVMETHIEVRNNKELQFPFPIEYEALFSDDKAANEPTACELSEAELKVAIENQEKLREERKAKALQIARNAPKMTVEELERMGLPTEPIVWNPGTTDEEKQQVVDTYKSKARLAKLNEQQRYELFQKAAGLTAREQEVFGKDPSPVANTVVYESPANQHILSQNMPQSPANRTFEGENMPQSPANPRIRVYPKYQFNEDLEHYIVFLKSVGKNVVVEKWKHDAMQKAYANWMGNPESINELCHKYGFTKQAFEEYKKVFGWTHDMIPISDETMSTQSEDAIIEDLMQTKKMNVFQKFTKQEWADTQADALKWQEFKAKGLDPFENLLRNFDPRPLPVTSYTGSVVYGSTTLMVGLSDLHFGSIADADVTGQVDHDINRLNDLMTDYIWQIQRAQTARTYPFNKVVVCVVGDILHSLSGFTKKGTLLDFDQIGEAQFDAALNSMIGFMTAMLRMFPFVEVKVVKGNHAGIDEYILFKAVAAFFTKEPRINFELAKARALMFKVLDTLVVMDHGDSDYVKAKVPTANMKRQSYVQSLFLQHPEKLVGVKAKIFIQGDMHHFEAKEMNDFEYYMFGTIMPGDKYSAHLNLRSRPRQNGLVVTDEGVSELLNFYFDRNA